MPLMYNYASLQMEWCLDCHRAPEKNLRPRDQVFNMRYEQPTSGKPVEFDGKEYTDQVSLGTDLVEEVQVAHGDRHYQLFDVPSVQVLMEAGRADEQRRPSSIKRARMKMDEQRQAAPRRRLPQQGGTLDLDAARARVSRDQRAGVLAQPGGTGGQRDSRR